MCCRGFDGVRSIYLKSEAIFTHSPSIPGSVYTYVNARQDRLEGEPMMGEERKTSAVTSAAPLAGAGRIVAGTIGEAAAIARRAATGVSSTPDSNSDRRAVIEDLYWAVLSSREFLFNH